MMNEQMRTILGRFAFRALVVMVFGLWGATESASAEEIRVSGITEPVFDVTLSSDVAARISRIPFDEGDIVKKGDVLIEIEHSVEDLEVERRELIWKDKSELESAQAREKTLKTLLAANRDLYESTKSISKEELETKELEYALAVAELHRLEQAELREKVEYEMAKASAGKRLIRAPIDGMIIELLFEVGESCDAQQPIMRLVDPKTCRFVSNVEERIGRQLKKESPVSLAIVAGAGTVVREGKIVYVSPVVDQASGLLVVKAEFRNKDAQVRPGVSGEMVLTVE